MGGWVYSAHRLNGDGTSTLLDPDLPLRGAAVTRELSGPGSITGSIAPTVRRLVGADGYPTIRAWSTAIMATDDAGKIQAGCIVSEVPHAPDSQSISISSVGFTGILKGMAYAGSKFFVEEDPLTIVRAIWDHWQSQPGGNLGLVLDRTTKTGAKIGTKLNQVEYDTQNGPMAFESGPYKLTEYETNDLGGAVDELAKEHHFDYMESHAWTDDGGLSHRLDFGHPRIGTRREDLRFVVGENVTIRPQVTQGDYASTVLVRGAGDGPAMLRRWAVRPGETRLRRTRVIEDKTLKSNAAILGRGQWALPMLAGRPEVGEIVVRDHDNAPIGSWREGDEIELFPQDEWGSTPFFARVLSTTFNPEDLSVAKLSVELADKIPS